MPAKKTLKTTPPNEWKKIEPELRELPSGNSALLKRPNIYIMAKTGVVPDIVMKELSGESSGEFADKQATMEWMIAVSFVEPEVSLTKEEGKLHIDDIEDEDKQYVAMFLGLGEI